jgi:T-complex protein 11
MIPDGDISELEANWDAAHIMQEFHGSVLDFLAKAKWLGSHLKKHSAPCRDKNIDRMI